MTNQDLSMNKEAQVYFEQAVAKDIASLSNGEIEFIRARRDYLTDAEQEKFAEILSAKPKKEKEVEPTAEPFDGQPDPTAPVSEAAIPFKQLRELAKKYKINSFGVGYDALLAKVQEAAKKA